MKLNDFLLDGWLEEHRGARYDLASSTGPAWTLQELLDLMTPDERGRLLASPLSYGSNAGGVALRQQIASVHGVDAEDVQIVTGASEALLILFFLAAEPGANVVVPAPSFPTFIEVPRGLGLDVRAYRLRPEHGFQIDVDEVRRLCDGRTKLLLVNSPHNPTGATIDEPTLSHLHDFCAEHGIQFVADEIYHPIYHGVERASAAGLPHATIMGDLSKAMSVSGLRVGWLIDRDRIARYRNARSYFTISNSSPSEVLAEVAVRERDRIYDRTRAVAAANLALLDTFFHTVPTAFTWVRPTGGLTTFPALKDGADARPLCRAAAERGVLLAPGDCFGHPPHFRVGVGACEHGFADALEILADVARSASVAS